METFLRKVFFENFYRKFFSLLAAILIWMVVSDSITTTRAFHRVPVRVINLPSDKTVRGVMPDGYLDRRITLTLTGTKSVLDQLGQNDVEVVVDALGKKGDWVVKVSKKNIVSLNRDIELGDAVSSVTHSELIIRMCRVITERIPVYIARPIGAPPQGYHFLDVWPQKLYHIITGPEDDVRQLQAEGVGIEFDLSSITKEDLDLLRDDDPEKDEVSYVVPDLWKKVRIPYLNNFAQTLHCPEFPEVRLDFLFKEILPIETRIPVRLFSPDVALKSSLPIMRECGAVGRDKDGFCIRGQLYAANVSRLFLDVVKEYLQVVILPINNERTLYCWEPQFVAEKHLENAYVARALAEEGIPVGNDKGSHSSREQQEEYHRIRFREYVRNFTLCRSQDEPLFLKIELTKEGLEVYDAKQPRKEIVCEATLHCNS